MSRSPFDGMGRAKTRRHPSARTSVWPWVVAGLLLVPISCAGVILAGWLWLVQPEPPRKLLQSPLPVVVDEKPPPVPVPIPFRPAWDSVKDSASIGDVKVRILWAGRCEVLGNTRTRAYNPGKLLVVKLELTNQSLVRKTDFGGWNGVGLAEDEHGNRYRPWVPPAGWGFVEIPFKPGGTPEECRDLEIRGRITLGTETIHPNSKLIGLLLFEKPVDAANEFRLSLPADSLGATGDVRIKTTAAK